MKFLIIEFMRYKVAFFILILFSTRPIVISAQVDPWKITVPQVDPANYYGVTIANGMLGIVSSPEPFKIKNVVLAGVYDLYGRGRVSNFLNSFNLLDMAMEVDGYGQSASNLKQELDMHHASLTTSFDYGEKAFVTYTYYALRQFPFTVLIDVSITAKKSIIITPSSIIRAPDALKDVQNYYNEIYSGDVAISLLTSSAKSPTGKVQLCASTAFIFNEAKGQEPRLVHEMLDNNLHAMHFNKALQADETYTFSIVGSSLTSSHYEDPLNEVERLTIFASLQGHDRLLQQHAKAWDKLWESDIQLEGDPQAQQDVHNMLYHLYSFSRAGTSLSTSPMGLSGLGYNGHIFWDTELWMYPPLLLLHPEIAQSLIEYRFQRLSAAKENAFINGYEGAMFPWESAGMGTEETPVKYMSGTFEHHITGCVALAAWNFFCVTQNKDWLQQKGWPILSATADFWLSRVDKNPAGQYDIINVVGADEWAENVDNNAFTNGVAKVNLENAIRAAKVLGIKYKPEWKAVADNIFIEKFPDGVTKEYRSYSGQQIKQADVNLLSFPLKLVTIPEAIKKDLKYYETRVPRIGTPAMTQAIFALLYARLGEPERAYQFFTDGYEPNILPPFRVLAETKGGNNPYFATGAGGILQSLLMGFGGLDITPSGIVQLQGNLPARWKSLKFTGVGVDKKTFEVK